MFHFKFSLLFGYFSSTDSTAVATSRKPDRSRSSKPPKTSSPKASSIEQCTGDVLMDSREASLSATAREMQRLARLKYRSRGKPIKNDAGGTSLLTDIAISLEKAARMDRQSLESLEAATKRDYSMLPTRSKPALRQRPSTPADLVSSPQPRLQPNRIYNGTSPYDTPSMPTGSDLQIHSVPSNDLSDLSDSDLFRSDYAELFAPVQGSYREMAFSMPAYSWRLASGQQKQSPRTRVQKWLQESSDQVMRSLSEAEIDQQSSLENEDMVVPLMPVPSQMEDHEASGAIDDVPKGSARARGREQKQERPRSTGGHSLDSWGGEDENHVLNSSDSVVCSRKRW
ncbi:hypothetical protein Slin15195_G015780 [Septoria linicola]|uniref:Uncharacterized protein n=1 Tax=Septoria linicola TaxID=215465 RepID=A0A9Q9AF21_9PEZI|nr:hypothetical protein Slin15195_G015780 [Septoria linicola]